MVISGDICRMCLIGYLGFQVNEALKELIPGVRVLCLFFYVLGYYPKEIQRIYFSKVFEVPWGSVDTKFVPAGAIPWGWDGKIIMTIKLLKQKRAN